MSNTFEKYFENKILPAVTIEETEDALKVAEALQRGGLNVMEITFRTKTAKESIRKIANKAEGMTVGAGTLLKPAEVRKAKKAGAQFGLAPGLNPKVIEEAKKINFPFIPGVITPSGVEQALTLGCTTQKLFPAKCAGGISLLKAISGPYKHTGVSFIPMGGINRGNMKEYLVHPETLAVGGSWLAPKVLIQGQDFQQITENAKTSLNISQKFV